MIDLNRLDGRVLISIINLQQLSPFRSYLLLFYTLFAFNLRKIVDLGNRSGWSCILFEVFYGSLFELFNRCFELLF